MNKEEILERSRKENKNQDIFEKEVLKDGANVGAFAATALGAIFFIAQIMLGEGTNYGLFAIISSVPATEFIIKAIKLRRRHEIVIAGVYTFSTAVFTIAHFYNLISSCTIL